MTNEEFDNGFDVFYNSITSNQAPGLDTYEKSVFLTTAQDLILKAYFDPRLNKAQEGYDDSPRRQIDFSMVTLVDSYTESDDNFEDAIYDPRSNSKSVKISSKPLIVLNERIVVTRSGEDTYLTVVPITFFEYDRLTSKPFKRPLKNQAWRIFNTANGSNVSDLVVGPADTIKQYVVRYIRKPRPIIIGPLDGLKIENTEYDETAKACELDESLHPVILQRAIELAKAAYSGDLTSQLALGQASQTEMGTIQQAR